MVEKRLKQNREAARRSRDRKRQLKEDLRNRIPVLQEEHDSLTDQVDELLKHLWVWPRLYPHTNHSFVLAGCVAHALELGLTCMEAAACALP